VTEWIVKNNGKLNTQQHDNRLDNKDETAKNHYEECVCINNISTFKYVNIIMTFCAI